MKKILQETLAEIKLLINFLGSFFLPINQKCINWVNTVRFSKAHSNNQQINLITFSCGTPFCNCPVHRISGIQSTNVNHRISLYADYIVH